MVELRVDHVVDGTQAYCETRSQTCRQQTHGQTQTCVSRTFGVAHQICCAIGSCFMFHCFKNVFVRGADRQLARPAKSATYGLTKMSKARHC